MNVSRHHKMTNEVYTEVLEIYKTLSEDYHHEYFPAAKLITALKALCMEPPTPETEKRTTEMEGIGLKEFLRIISEQYIDQSHWIHNSMSDAFSVYDKDGNGYLDALEMKRVYTKLGENLSDAEMEDQIREFDIDGDNQMVISEFFKMVLSTRGSDFVFDDA